MGARATGIGAGGAGSGRAGLKEMRRAAAMPVVPVAVRIVSVFDAALKALVIVPDAFFGFHLLLDERSSLVSVMASEVGHVVGVPADVFGPVTAAKMFPGPIEVGLEFVALRLIPMSQLFLGALG